MNTKRNREQKSINKSTTKENVELEEYFNEGKAQMDDAKMLELKIKKFNDDMNKPKSKNTTDKDQRGVKFQNSNMLETKASFDNQPVI